MLGARLAYLSEKHNIGQASFLTFDAMRQTAQCIGRVVRSKTDYGVICLADKRYNNTDKRTKLPQWVRACMDERSVNLSTDAAVAMAQVCV